MPNFSELPELDGAELSRQLFDESHDAILIVDPASARVVGANRTAGRLIGRRSEALRGVHVGELFTADDPLALSRLSQLIQQVSGDDGRASAASTGLRLCGDRGARDVELSVSNLSAAEGTLSLLVARDVTDRVQVERHLDDLLSATLAPGGKDLLPTLMENLARALSVRHALLLQLAGDQLQVVAHNGRQSAPLADGVTRIEGSPFEQLVERGSYACDRAMQAEFPDCAEVLELAADSFFGCALTSSTGETIGYLCVLDSRPLVDTKRTETLIRVFGCRASSELERIAGSIADRGEAEQHRNDAFDLLNDIIESTSDAVYVKDRQGRHLMANSACLQIIGKSREEVVGGSDADVFAADVAEALREADLAIMESGQQATLEECVNDAVSGEMRTYLSVKVPRRDAWGEVSGIIGISRDITERRRAENALRHVVDETAKAAGDDFYRALTQHLAEALGVRYVLVAEVVDGHNARTLAVWAHDRHADNFEYALKGTPCANVLEQSFCVYESDVQSQFPADLLLGEMGVEGYMGAPLVGLGGETVGVLAALDDKPVVAREETTALFHVFAKRAATELERSKNEQALRESQAELRIAHERLELAVNGTSDGLWDWNVATGDVWISPRGMELLGHEAAEETKDAAAWGELIHPDDIADVRQATEQHFAENTVYDIEHRMRSKSGEFIWFRARGRAVRDQTGRPIRMSGSMQDISARRQAELAVQTREQLYRNAISAAHSAVYQIDFASNTYVYIGDEIEDVLGYRADEITPDMAEQTVRRHIMQGAAQGISHAEAANRFHSGELQVWNCDKESVAADGSIVWLADSSVLLYNENGEPSGCLGIVSDITDRRLAAQQIEESRQAAVRSRNQLIDAIDSFTEAFALYDADDRLVICNQKYREAYSDCVDLLEPGSLFLDQIRAGAARGQIAAAVGREEEWVRERLEQHENPGGVSLQELGDGRWLQVSERRTREGGIVGVRTDITERKLAVDALRESEARLRSVLETSSVFILLTDLEGGILYINQLADGFEMEQVTGSSVFNYMPAEAQELARACIEQVIATGEPAEYEAPGLTSNQEMGWYFTRVGPVFRDEKVDGLTLFAIDITKRKRAQDDLKRFFDQPLNLMAVVGFAGDVQEVNVACERTLGHDRDEFLSNSYLAFVHPDDRPMAMAEVERLASGATTVDFQLRMLHKDGSERHVLWSALPDLEGGRFFATGQDMTERFQKDRLVELQSDMLEQIATGKSLSHVLDELCQHVESFVPDAVCSVMELADDASCLNIAAGPSLTPELIEAFNGLRPGPTSGSCGTAAFTGEVTIVTDVQSDPRWEPFREVAEHFGIGACWSVPIRCDDQVVATFAISHPAPRSPELLHNQLLEWGAHLAGIAIARERADLALRASETQFRSLAESNPSLVSIFSDTIHLYTNPEVSKFLGYSNDELLNMSCLDYVHADFHDLVRERSLARQRGEEVVNRYEIKLVTKDGRERWIDFSATAIQFAGQSAVLGVGLDITERKMAEEALQHAAAHFEVSEHCPALLSYIDADMRYQYNNPAYEQWLGLKPDQITGRKVRDVLGDEWFASLEDRFAEVLSGRTVTFEQEFVTPVRGGRWIQATYVPRFDSAERVIGFYTLVIDITDHKRAEDALRENEQMYRALFENSPAGIGIADESGWLLDMNKSMLDAGGYESKTEVSSKNVAEFYANPADRDRLLQQLRTDGFVSAESVELRRRDGSTFYALMSIAPVTLKGQACTLAVVEDISERRELEYNLQRFREILDEADEAVFVIDPVTAKFVDCNASATRNLQYSREELLTLRVQDIQVVAADVQQPQWSEFVERIKNQDKAVFIEGGHRRKDGTTFPVEVTVCCKEVAGQTCFLAIARDVTERVEREEELRFRQSVLESQTEASIDGILVVSNEREWLIWNERFAEIWQYPDEFIQRRDSVAAVQWASDRLVDPQAFRDRTELLYENGEGVSHDELHMRDGRIIDRHGAPIKSPDGDSYGRVWFYRDITSRKKAENLLVDHYQLLEQLATGAAMQDVLTSLVRAIESQVPGMKASVLILEGDRLRHGVAPSLPDDYNRLVDGTRIGPTVGSCGMAAFARRRVIVEDIQSSPLWDKFSDVAAQYNLRACWSQPIFSQANEVLGTFAFYYHEPRTPSDDELALIDSSAHLAGIAIEKTRSEQILRDSEQEHRVITESAQEVIITIDDEGQIVFANPAMHRTFGYHVDEVVGQNVTILIPEALRLGHTQALSRLNQRGAESRREAIEVSGLHKDGVVVAVELSFGRHTKDGKQFYTGILRDVSERKRVQQELQKRESELAHVGRLTMLGEAIAEIAHEINQPLYAISNFAKASRIGLEKDTITTEQMIERFDRIDGLSTSAGEILNRIGGFLRRQDSQRTAVSINEVIGQSMQLLEFDARRKRVRVDVTPLGEDQQIAADRVQIQQVLVNLLRNAFEAMDETPTDQRIVQVEAEVHDDCVQVAVKDRGHGFGGEIPDTVFDAFHSTKSEGMGMGLAISRSIVESHGGDLWVTENEGGGVTFHISLPVE
ncbi:MAG: PAS domain S-box protein [Pirellulaceae bacterium]|nr:PAS domain S-box protein [Pirellulaceae bacterium]